MAFNPAGSPSHIASPRTTKTMTMMTSAFFMTYFPHLFRRRSERNSLPQADLTGLLRTHHREECPPIVHARPSASDHERHPPQHQSGLWLVQIEPPEKLFTLMRKKLRTSKIFCRADPTLKSGILS